MDARSITRRFFEELWNERRLEVAGEIVAPDCVTHQLKSAVGVPASAERGPLALQEHVRAWLHAFPDLRWEIQASVAEGDHVATLAIARGTHRGDWQGVPATGRPVTIQCAVVHRVSNGRIVEDWVVTEALGLYQQLGLGSSLGHAAPPWRSAGIDRRAMSKLKERVGVGRGL